ncbi:hypothetical protein EGJ52_22710 [Pseudomonas luteola]|nr:hypothetical protein EGJ52_22710 [Pseudomonas luteola]
MDNARFYPRVGIRLGWPLLPYRDENRNGGFVLYAAIGVLSAAMLAFGGYLDYKNFQKAKQQKADQNV